MALGMTAVAIGGIDPSVGPRLEPPRSAFRLAALRRRTVCVGDVRGLRTGFPRLRGLRGAGLAFLAACARRMAISTGKGRRIAQMFRPPVRRISTSGASAEASRATTPSNVAPFSPSAAVALLSET
jgi:hypothetical protein